MRERVLVPRERDIENESVAARHELLGRVDVPAGRCGTSTDKGVPERAFTLNGEIRPQIPRTQAKDSFGVLLTPLQIVTRTWQ